ncbi:MAG: glycosyltransferase family 4 protein [Microgenomates group bacterium]|nr:glycosyltransferase family 4 protein [Microgenomates group bacterium]
METKNPIFERIKKSNLLAKTKLKQFNHLTMRILFFSPYYYPYTSGITTYPQKIFKFLAKKHEIEVLTFKDNKKLKKVEKLNGYLIIRMNYLFKVSKGFISPQSILYFYKKAAQSDIVILNQPNFEGLLLAVFAKMMKKKIYSIFHCQVFLNDNWVTKLINFFLNKSMIIQLILSDKIIIYTKDYANSLPYFLKLREKTLTVLPPIESFSIDKKFYNQLLKLKANKIWLGFAGRIATEKGIEYLVQSINQLTVGAEKISLVFAGPYGKNVAGENNYYNKITRLLNGKKINHLFLGNLFKNKLFSFYKAIDVLVLPSINSTEAFGMVQAEAMLVGTPVIATNLPGVRMPIKLTKMGTVVEPKNEKQLAEAIFEIINNRKKYTNPTLIKNAQKIFDIKKVYQFWEKIINEKN